MSDVVTINDLKNLCEKLVSLRTLKESIDAESKANNKDIAEIHAQILAHLDEHDLKRFDFGGGKVTVADKTSVKVVDKYKLFEWLKAQGNFEETVTVHSATVNRIYKDELEAAKEVGNVEFLTEGIPGLSEPTTFRSIRVLK